MIQRYIIKAVAESEYETSNGRMQSEKVIPAYIASCLSVADLRRFSRCKAKQQSSAKQSFYGRHGQTRLVFPSLMCISLETSIVLVNVLSITLRISLSSILII